ncbi:MAG: hypothetical protein P8Y13_15265 [Deinococcales bacterium]
MLIGSAGNVDTSQPLVTGSMFFLNIFGGIFIPLQVLPKTMAHIAAVLPSYRYAELGWAIANGHAPSTVGITVLAAWTIGLCVTGVLAYNRGTVQS